jgi:hypothetical protein
MQSNKPNKYLGIPIYWTENLVGTPGRFGVNLLLTIVGGGVYSFGVWPSIYMLAVFGVVSPLLFTFCLYSLVPLFGNNDENPFPKVFKSRSSSAWVMLFDMAIVITMAILIHIDIIDYLFFRLLQTVIFPALMLFILRFLYLGVRRE